jgi:hypothetical protein
VDSISCGLASRYFDSAGIVPQLSDHTRVRCGKNDVDNSARFDRQRATIGDDKSPSGVEKTGPLYDRPLYSGIQVLHRMKARLNAYVRRTASPPSSAGKKKRHAHSDSARRSRARRVSTADVAGRDAAATSALSAVKRRRSSASLKSTADLRLVAAFCCLCCLSNSRPRARLAVTGRLIGFAMSACNFAGAAAGNPILNLPCCECLMFISPFAQARTPRNGDHRLRQV